MYSLQDSMDFDRFELIPRQDTIPPPKPDISVDLGSKIFRFKHDSENTDDNKTQLDRQADKIIQQKQSIIYKLQEQLVRVEGIGKFEKQANIIYTQIFQKIRNLLQRPQIGVQDLPNEISNRITSLNEQIRDLKQRQGTKQSECQSQSENNKNNLNRGNDVMSKLVMEKEQTIKKLRDQLLKSTQNNINAIFHTQLTAQQCLTREVIELRNQVQMLKSPVYHFKKDQKQKEPKQECPHHQKITTLIKNYEQMLEEYRRNDRIVADLQTRQDQAYSYFSALRAELTHTVQVTCNSYSDRRLNQLQHRIQDTLNGLSIPQKVKTEGDNDIRIRQLLNEIDRLNQKVTAKQMKIYEITKKLEEEAGMRSWNAYQSHVSQLEHLEQRLREKDKRIGILENTIIDQIETRKKIQLHQMENQVKSIGTVNSQQSDLQKQRNNIRNLKTLVSELKEENRKLRAKLKDATMNTEADFIMERINKDQNNIKMIQTVIEAILEGHNQRCKCLQKVTDAILGFTQEFPQIEDILINFGVIETSSTLLGGMENL